MVNTGNSAAVILLGVLLFGTACSGTSAPAAPVIFVPHETPSAAAPAPEPPLLVVDYSVPPAVTGTWAAACHVNGVLPDRSCTPGSIGPRHRDAVCVSGFELTERPRGTEAAKTAVMRAYGVPASSRSRTELDHLVPLSLGGSNDATNLWPEVSDLPNGGFRNSKDNVERKVLTAVCRAANPVPLDQAQLAMAHNWTTALQTLGIA